MQGMIFDRMCRYAETIKDDDNNNLFSLLQQAALFSVPIIEELTTKSGILSMPEDEFQGVASDFFFPFPVIVVEDPHSAVMFTSDSTLRGPQLSEGFHSFIICEPLTAAATMEADVASIMRDTLPGTNISDVFLFVIGKLIVKRFYREKTEFCCEVSGEITTYAAIDVKNNKLVVRMDPKKMPYEKRIELLQNASAGLRQVFHINLPSQFIVEMSPVKERKEKPGRILRSPDRPVYTTLTPGEIRKRYIGETPPTPTGRTVKAHDRRSHLRTLRSDRFVNKKGSTIVVPACWIGPSEVVRGGHKYKVMLDR